MPENNMQCPQDADAPFEWTPNTLSGVPEGGDENTDQTGWEEMLDGDGVCLVEWGERVAGLLPPHTLFIRIEKDLKKGPDYRLITLTEKGAAK